MDSISRRRSRDALVADIYSIVFFRECPATAAAANWNSLSGICERLSRCFVAAPPCGQVGRLARGRPTCKKNASWREATCQDGNRTAARPMPPADAAVIRIDACRRIRSARGSHNSSLITKRSIIIRRRWPLFCGNILKVTIPYFII